MLATTLASVALLPGLLTPTLPDVKASRELPVLLPSTLITKEKTRLYARGVGDPSEYLVTITNRKDCSANYCTVAYLSGRKGLKASGGSSVKLANGRKGRYQKKSCGASCTPPSVSWQVRDVLYTVQTHASRKDLMKMANSAIKKGPR
jgi:hypothetical protein